MKTLKILCPLIFSFLLVYCSDDDNGFGFDNKSLKQTKWSGTIVESYSRDGNKITRRADVAIVFNTETQGEYSVKYDTDIDPTITDFKYTIDDKMLIIQNGLTLGGNWLLIYNTNNKMELEQGTGGDDSYKSTLTLDRKY